MPNGPCERLGPLVSPRLLVLLILAAVWLSPSPEPAPGWSATVLFHPEEVWSSIKGPVIRARARHSFALLRTGSLPAGERA